MSLRSRGVSRPAIPSIQSEIAILNAEQYDDEPPYRTARSPPKRGAASNGKRPSPSDRAENGDDDEDEVKKKRSRGRPRLDTKDETAADRRRTQIRLAQRAYRHRKDTAITTLEEKVKELETVNETMGKEFSKFYDVILAQGILDTVPPHTSSRLRAIADKLLRLASTAGAGHGLVSSESDEPAMKLPGSRRNTGLNPSGDVGYGSSTSVIADFGLDTASTFSSSLPSAQQGNTFSYEVITQATPNNASFPFFTAIDPTQSQQQGHHPGLPTPNPYPKLPSPRSYASHERTFSRRLQRTTLERGLKMASMPNPPTVRYAEAFGFCLLFESRESVIRRLAAGLRRTASESLDTWKAPITTLPGDQYVFLESTFGASGSDASNQALLPLGRSSEVASFPNMTAPFGPNSQSESALDDRIEQRIRLICRNFEGEFFTSEEVELFLRRLGIHIPQHADYVEAEVDLNDLGESDEVNLSVPSTNNQCPFGGPGLVSGSSFGGFISQSNMWSANASAPGNFTGSTMGTSSLGSQAINVGAVFDTSDPHSGLGYMNTQDFGPMWPTASTWTKTKVTVDVQRLIDELASKAVCLGRAPGVRPKDVVRAIKIAAGLVS